MAAGSSLAESILNQISKDDAIIQLIKEKDVQKTILHYKAFIIYIAVGVFLMAFNTIFAVIYVCTCCCNCCYKKPKNDTKTNFIVVIILGVGFVFLTFVLFTGIVMAYTNTVNLYTYMTSDDDKNVIHIINKAADKLQNAIIVMKNETALILSKSSTQAMNTKVVNAVVDNIGNSEAFKVLDVISQRMKSLKDQAAKLKPMPVIGNKIPDLSSLPVIDTKVYKADLKKKLLDASNLIDLTVVKDLLDGVTSMVINYIQLFKDLFPKISQLQKYTKYIKTPLVIICIVILATFILMILGFILVVIKRFGLLCMIGFGKTFLKAGTLTTLIIYPFFMVLTIVLFVIGSVLFIMVCRYLTQESLQSQLDALVQEQMKTSFIIESPISTLLTKCQSDSESMGTILKISSATINQLPFLSDIIDQKVKSLKPQLLELKSNLKKLETEILKLSIVYGPSDQVLLNKFMKDLENFQKEIPEQVIKFDQSINKLVANLPTLIKDTIGDFIKMKLTSVRCKELSSSVRMIVDLLCGKLVQAVNGMWCGLGMYLFFVGPLIFVTLITPSFIGYTHPSS